MNRTIPGGPLNPVPEMQSIPDMIHRTASRIPDSVAVREPLEPGKFRSITYSHLAGNMDWLARGILELNPKPVVGIVGKNSISWYTTYLATMRAGGIVVPIDPALPEADMHTILHYSGTNLIFHDAEFTDCFQGLKDVRPVTMNSGFEDARTTYGGVLRSGRLSKGELPASYDVHRVAVISYTSGTTGTAKGVMHSQNSILTNVKQIISFVNLDEADTFLSVLPVHHMYEGTAGFLLPMSMGAQIAIVHGLRYIADDLVTTGATAVLAVPLVWETMYRRIMEKIRSGGLGKARLGFGMAVSAAGDKLGMKGLRKKVFGKVHEKFGGKLRLLISGGAGIDPVVVEGFEKLGFKVLQGYGLTETAPIISVNRIKANRYGSVGPVLHGMECRIDEPDGTGTGEIVVRGPNVMLGYYGDPEATRKVLSEEGWFRTGDYGYVDPDGFLFITGRKKNVIIAKNGKNIYPEEIETKLNRFRHIRECVVFGKASETKGEEIFVLVVPDRDLLIEEADSQGRKITVEDEVQAIRDAVKRYNAKSEIHKRIAGFLISEDELPKTTTKKIKRNTALKEAGVTPGRIFKA